MSDNASSYQKNRPVFRTTRWSIVASCRQGQPEEAKAALERLCQWYWFPIYAFIRRQGLSPQAAEDTTQDFFVDVIRRGIFEAAEPQLGRLRSFLLKSVQNHLIDRQRKEHAAKRRPPGGVLSLDTAAGETRYQAEARNDVSPEQQWNRRWAMTLIERSLSQLSAELDERFGRECRETIIRHLTDDGDRPALTQAADRLGLTANALKVRIHRARARYRLLLRNEVAETVCSPEEVDAELKFLFASL